MKRIHPDSIKIDALGGTAAVARMFGIKQPSVTKWRYSGIPPARLMYLRVVRPDVFQGDAPITLPGSESTDHPAADGNRVAEAPSA